MRERERKKVREERGRRKEGGGKREEERGRRREGGGERERGREKEGK